MKKTILILAAAFAAVVSCQKAETDNTAPVLTKITVVAENSLGADTKVTVGDLEGGACPVLWQAGDRVCLIDRTQDQPRTILAETTVPSEYAQTPSANLTFDVYFTKYPDTKTLGLMVCREGFLYNDAKELPQNQVQKGLGAENTNMMDYMYGYTRITRSCRDKDGNVISNLSFSVNHPFAYVKIPFWSTKFAGYKVASIVLTNEDGAKRVSGRMTINGSALASNAISGVYSSQDNVNLTFSEDVVVPGSADQAKDAWIVAMPTVINGETAANSIYSVTFNLENGQGRIVTAVVKFKTTLNAESVNVLKVGEILEEDVTASKDISNDFLEQYLAGHDIKIGDLVVNKKNYPDYSLQTPSKISLDLLRTGGLIFIDDENGDSEVDLTTTNLYETCPSTTSGGLVLIGRYKIAGKQTELKLKSWRTSADIAFANVKIVSVASGDYLFAKTSNDTKVTSLRFQDCNIDCAAHAQCIRDKQAAGSSHYSVISFDNCVVKMSDSKANAALILQRYKYDPEQVESQTFSVTNSVVYVQSLANYDSQLIKFYWDNSDTASQCNAPNTTLNISNNTILNIHGNTGIIRRNAQLGTSVIEANLVVADNTANNAVITTSNNQNIFFVKNTTTLSSGNNYLTVINYTGDPNTIKCFVPFNPGKTESFNPTDSDVVITAETEDKPNPFTSLNYTTGYFPVNTSVVTNGAGASYETKYFIPQN